MPHTGPGITPAWAGKSRCGSSASPRGWDHPRVGGEKFFNLIQFVENVGSPPRGRGKGWNPCWMGLLNRITPAWAGKSCIALRRFARCGDHPRVGGEKSPASVPRVYGPGSPPHWQGKGRRVVDHHPLPRITPAWAGKRQTAAMPRTMTRVHPRMGREKTMYFEDKYFCRGSPPRRRGKVVLTEHHHAAKRITPAWAGKRPISR